jgi:hypothetical protein
MSTYALDRGLVPIGAPAKVSDMGLLVIVLAVLVAWRAPVMRGLAVSSTS